MFISSPNTRYKFVMIPKWLIYHVAKLRSSIVPEFLIAIKVCWTKRAISYDKKTIIPIVKTNKKIIIDFPLRFYGH